MMGTSAWVAIAIIVAWVLVALGVCLGWRARGSHEKANQTRRDALADAERASRIATTGRVSIARPGSRPGRITKASIDMGASDMRQSSREL